MLEKEHWLMHGKWVLFNARMGALINAREYEYYFNARKRVLLMLGVEYYLMLEEEHY